MSIFSHTKRGITLIESVVSIALLSVAITGPMTLAAHSLKAAGSARNEMIATHLAEEGLEVVHSMRDNFSADDSTPGKTGWMTNLFTNCDGANGCVIDTTQRSAGNAGVWNTGVTLPLQKCLAACGNSSIVYVNPATGFYRQQLAALGAPFAPTPFRRTIFLSSTDGATRQVRVTATVTYPGYGGQTQTITISEDLYNWFPYIQ